MQDDALSCADEAYKPRCAPSVLITFINMMMFNKEQPESNIPLGCSQYMFEGQGLLQMICLYLALACIPVMLFGKPLYVTYVNRNKSPEKSYVSNPLHCLRQYWLSRVISNMMTRANRKCPTFARYKLLRNLTRSSSRRSI